MNSYLACCGLYCGACSSLLAWEKNKGVASVQKVLIDPEERPCAGCSAPEMEGCEFIRCAKEHATDCCAFCPDFPCPRISGFNNTAAPHHHDVLENLYRIRSIGKTAWLQEQKEFWSCAVCGCRTHWYQDKCENCGAEWKPVYQE